MVYVLVSNRKHVSMTSTSYWSQSLNPERRECTCKSRHKQYERLFELVTFCTSFSEENELEQSLQSSGVFGVFQNETYHGALTVCARVQEGREDKPVQDLS